MKKMFIALMVAAMAIAACGGKKTAPAKPDQTTTPPAAGSGDGSATAPAEGGGTGDTKPPAPM
jgi:hypothetical protein